MKWLRDKLIDIEKSVNPNLVSVVKTMQEKGLSKKEIIIFAQKAGATPSIINRILLITDDDQT